MQMASTEEYWLPMQARLSQDESQFIRTEKDSPLTRIKVLYSSYPHI